MTINCKGQLIDLNTPKVMGILNVTPDSFFDGGQYTDNAAMLRQAEAMLLEGADFIDVGGYSSRPGATDITEAEEINRIVGAIGAVSREFPDAILSVDTFRSGVARAAIDSGAAIVNDISAGSLDANMMDVVASLRVPYIMMHMRGNPATMQTLTNYSDIVREMMVYFSEKVATARSFGISDVLIDPGFGFAKTLEQNYEVLRHLEDFALLELPILVGVSRKSMVYKPLGTSAAEALNGTTVLHAIALSKGAKILRVHDVKEAVEAVKLFQMSNR